MWQLKRFVEIANREGVSKAIQKTRHHFRVVRHRFHKRILIRTSCDIRQSLPQDTKLPHPTGIVIGIGAEIGEGVKIYQNVGRVSEPFRLHLQ